MTSPYMQSFDVILHDVLLWISAVSVFFSIGIFENFREEKRSATVEDEGRKRQLLLTGDI